MNELEEKINRKLSGFSDVSSLALSYEAVIGYNMQLVLQNSEGKAIQLSCRDVSGLSMEKFGGGLSQLAGLRAIDISSYQLDRIKIRFCDLAPERMAFECASADIQEIG